MNLDNHDNHSIDHSIDPCILEICVTCRSNDGRQAGDYRPGAVLFQALIQRLNPKQVVLQPVECLSVCKRPCTLALRHPKKWTYIFGDIGNNDEAVRLVETSVALYNSTEDGIIAWNIRPKALKTGVVARLPPLSNLGR